MTQKFCEKTTMAKDHCHSWQPLKMVAFSDTVKYK